MNVLLAPRAYSRPVVRAQAHVDGLSLVELLIAIAIGLIITLAVSSAYLAGTGVQTTQSESSRQLEAARFAMQVLAGEIAKGGYRSVEGGNPQFGDGGNGVSAYAGTDGNAPPATLAASSRWGDTIVVRFEGQSDGLITTCHGATIGENIRVTETLGVVTDANSNPWLACHVTSINTDTGANGGIDCLAWNSSGDSTGDCLLIPEVESLQALWGIDEEQSVLDPNFNAVNFYAPAAVVNTLANGWQKVMNVRPAIVVRSARGDIDVTSNRTLNMFGSTYAGTSWGGKDVGRSYTPPSDGRLRHIFSTDIAVRNYAY